MGNKLSRDDKVGVESTGNVDDDFYKKTKEDSYVQKLRTKVVQAYIMANYDKIASEDTIMAEFNEKILLFGYILVEYFLLF